MYIAMERPVRRWEVFFALPLGFSRNISELFDPFNRNHLVFDKTAHVDCPKQNRVQRQPVRKRQPDIFCIRPKEYYSSWLRSSQGMYFVGWSLPGLITLLGNITINRAEMQSTQLPISSSRNPSHSFEPLLWKSILRLSLTRFTFSCLNNSCFLNDLIVITPAILSEKWWMTGALVMESRRVNSREDAR